MFRLASWSQGPAHSDLGISKYLVLNSIGKQAHQPRIGRQHPGDPRGRAVSLPEFSQHLDQGTSVALVASIPFGHAQPEDTSLLQCLERFVMKASMLFVPGRVFLKDGGNF